MYWARGAGRGKTRLAKLSAYLTAVQRSSPAIIEGIFELPRVSLARETTTLLQDVGKQLHASRLVRQSPDRSLLSVE